MEKHLNCVLLLSLREMCVRRVVAHLYSIPENLASALKHSSFRFPVSSIRYLPRPETWEDKIKDKVKKLEIPETLTKQIIDVVEPIGKEVRKWKRILDEFHLSFLENGQPDSPKLIFTSNGIVDDRKTAEELVRCDKLDIVERYNIACIFCIEDYIPIFWEELPEKIKEVYGNNDNMSPELPFCWPHILKKEHSKLDILVRSSQRNLKSFNQYAFEYSASINFNKTATEYFFQKLSHEEREASLMSTAHTVASDEKLWVTMTTADISAVLFYLLSLMTPEQQMEIFKAQPVKVLLRFLDWPWQVLFLENTDLLWTYLPPSEYLDLQYKLIRKLWSLNHYSVKLFQNFFIRSPLDFKKCLAEVNSTCTMYLVCNFLNLFFDYGNSECIKLIFRNVDGGERVKIVFQQLTLHVLFRNILAGRLYLVEVCIREAMLCKEDRKRLKDALKECMKTGTIEKFKDNQWRLQFKGVCQKLEEFFDKIDASAEKKSKDLKC